MPSKIIAAVVLFLLATNFQNRAIAQPAKTIVGSGEKRSEDSKHRWNSKEQMFAATPKAATVPNSFVVEELEFVMDLPPEVTFTDDNQTIQFPHNGPTVRWKVTVFDTKEISQLSQENSKVKAVPICTPETLIVEFDEKEQRPDEAFCNKVVGPFDLGATIKQPNGKGSLEQLIQAIRCFDSLRLKGGEPEKLKDWHLLLDDQLKTNEDGQVTQLTIESGGLIGYMVGPTAFSKLKQLDALEDLNINGLRIDGKNASEVIGDLKQLKTLMLRGETGDFEPAGEAEMKNICRCKTIQKLSLGLPTLDGAALAHVNELQNLKELYLGKLDEKTIEAGLKSFTQLKNLENLFVVDLPYKQQLKSSTAFNSLSQFDGLKTLTVEDITEPAVLSIKLPGGIETLDLRSVQLGDEGIKHLCQFGSLSYLRLTNYDSSLDFSGLTEKSGAAFSRLKQLKEIETVELPLGDAAAAALSELPKLASVIIKNGKLTDAALLNFSKMKSLEALDVRGNQAITEEAAKKFEKAKPDTSFRYGK